MSLSTDLIQDMYSTGSKFIPVVLLTVTHKSFSEPIRISSDNRDIISQNTFKENIYGTVSRGNDFIFFPFKFKLPSAHTTEAPRTSLTISNATRELMPYIRNLQPKDAVPKVTLEVIVSEDPDNLIMSFPELDIVQINYGVLEISFELSAVNLAKEPFPSGIISPTYFKGVFAEL